MKRLNALALVVAVTTTAALLVQSGAQVKKGKERPLSTKHLMAGMIQSNCGALGKALQGEGPKDDKAWDQAAMQAELLNEAGHVLMADGRCPDGKWADASKTLRDCSQVVLKAIEAKKVDDARAAFGAMTKSCGDCHAAHKK